MSNAEHGGSSETRRKQLLFRCQRRGFKELDLVFGAFAAEYLGGLNAAELEQLNLLLNAPDDDVYAWLRGYEAAPARYASPVFDKLKAICQRKSPTWTV
ncbi:MAG TPA: succinate dehydrogenase assembly factor 2 [Rhizomicrobium sp.]|jgi:antitoxin CptB|nr:succinate dehydrogenase assembly factor 2 [Rhizomicrobium sp.]